MIKIKSISKRVLAVLLATLMLLTSGIVGTLAANVDLVDTGAYKELAETGANINTGTKLYFQIPNGSWWTKDNAWFAACFTKSGGYSWVKATWVEDAAEGKVFSVVAPSSGPWSNVIFKRMNPASQTLADSNRWNETSSLTYDGTNNLYKLDDKWYKYVAPSDRVYADTIYVDIGDENWSKVYAYRWTEGASSNNDSWPGAEMTHVSGTIYSIPRNGRLMIIFSNNGSSQSADLAIPSNGNDLYSLESSSWSTYVPPGFTYTTAANPTAGGTVTATPASPATEVTLTATPETGYEFVEWTVTGGTVESKTSASTTFTITANNATAVASFTKLTYTLGVNQTGANGTVTVGEYSTTSPTYRNTVDYGTYDYSVQAPSNYKIKTLTVGDSNVADAVGKTQHSGTVSVTKDTNINVTYELVSHTVTYNVNGTETTESVKHEGNPKSVPSTDRTGYTFLGWSTSSDGSSGYVTVTDETITGNVTYYAVYKINTYTVNFVDCNGKVFATQQVSYGSTATAPDTTNIPTPDGKEFNGWDKNINTTITGDTTFTAEYVDKPYAFALTVIPEDGTGGTVNNPYGDTVTHGQTITLTATPNTAEFYEFGGWNVKGECVVVENGETITISKIASAITVEAVFKTKDTGTVNATADDKMGTVSPSTSTVALNTPVKVTATALKGYKFSSWEVTSSGTAGTNYTVSENDNEITITPLTDAVVVNVEAVFVGVTGTVNFVAGNGGTVNNTTSITETVTYPNTATATPKATGEGFQFAGWTVTAKKADGTNATKGTDYNYTVNNDTIAVTVTTDSVTVTATANFSSGNIIKIYTSSDSDFSKLHLTENNGSNTQDVFNGTQTKVKFGDEPWYTTDSVKLTAGYNKKIEAQLSAGDSTGTVIYVELSSDWKNSPAGKGDDKYPYLSVTSATNLATGYADELNAGDYDGMYQRSDNSGDSRYKPRDDHHIGRGTLVSGNIYKWTIPSEYVDELRAGGFVVYASDHTNNGAFWQTSAGHCDYVEGKNLYIVENNGYTSSSTNYCENRQTYAYNIAAAEESMSTQTEVVDITDILYPDGVWCGQDEIWLYFDSEDNCYATYRRALNTQVVDKDYKNAYEIGIENSNEYSSGWSEYKSAYETAVDVLGDGASTQKQIDDALEALKNTYGKLVQNQSIKVYLTHGMVNNNNNSPGYYGTSSFVSGYTNAGSAGGNINTVGVNVVTATVQRNQPVVVQTVVANSGYYVKGFVINGTKFKPASETKENVFTATITFTESSNVVPIYFKDGVDETNDNVVKLYAQIGDFEAWTDYIAAYVWYNDRSYEQFATWTGQLMIPDDSNDKGMYYTYVEKTAPSGSKVSGITFNNYGNNKIDTDKYINGTSTRLQTYDYHEFLALQDYDNITFVLKESDYDITYLPTSGSGLTADAVKNHTTYEVFKNIDGQPTDIYGDVLEIEPTKSSDALYIIRKGHVTATEGAGYGYIGTRTTNADTGETSLSVSLNNYTGEFYVDCYVYTGTGQYIGCFKSYELEDLEVLASSSGRKVDLSSYRGKPVFVDYESFTGNHDGTGTEPDAKRHDGEWFAYNDEDANFTVEVVSALETGNGEYEIAKKDADGLMNKATWGNVTVTANSTTGGIVTVAQGTDFSANATIEKNYNLVGWYFGEKDANGNVTIKDQYTTNRSFDGKATASMVYVAVYKAHVAGSIYVRNFAYNPMENVDVNKGQSLSMYAPKAYGEGKLDLSIRYVQVTILNEDGSVKVERPATQYNPEAYQDYIKDVATGQTLRITMFTKPTIETDYVYAWYRQTYDDAEQLIVNYEEVAPKTGPFGPDDAGDLQQFTFDYVIGTEIPSEIVIYSDVVHQSRDVTITYKYHNRYGDLVSYTTKYKLEGEEFKAKKPSYKTVQDLAPYVDDLYKKVTWDFVEDDITQNATDFTVYATEDPTFTVNLFVGDALPKTYEKVPFNTAMDIYAKDINSACNKRGGVWFMDANKDGKYTLADGDKLLNYGNYLGLVVTDDMTIVYTDDAELVYQIILGDPVYGREQTTDSSGNNLVDKIYVDYIISYMIPHFSGDKIDTEGKENDASDDVILKDDVNGNTPVQIKTLEAAGLKVDYGVVLEMVNVGGLTTEQFEKYYDVESMSDETRKALDHIISNKEDGKDVRGNGIKDGNTLATYFYVYESNNASNKNRVLKTFAFDNTPANQKKYYNVYGYLKITDKANNTEIFYSNPKTLNIMNESIENTGN